MIRGWRLVEVAPADAARIAAMTDADRSAHFDTIVGAAEVKGKVTDRTRFVQQTDAALRFDAPLTQSATMWVGEKNRPRRPLRARAGRGRGGAGLSPRRSRDDGQVGVADAAPLRRRRPRPRAPAEELEEGRRQDDLHAVRAQPRQEGGVRGAIAARHARRLRRRRADGGLSSKPSTLCFGAPTLRVAAGEVVYLGDFSPYDNAKRIDGTKVSMLAHTMHPDDARKVLRPRRQPALAEAFRPAAWRNQATYACAGVRMDRWDVDGAPALEPAAVVQTASR
ncbi:hypothetical protein AB5I41_20715 [Sphingomonas sp. MMS24-JH45]